MKPWGIFRTFTSIDEFGKRHTVEEWVLKNGPPGEFLSFDTEREARAAAGVYNAMDRVWHYIARKFSDH